MILGFLGQIERRSRFSPSGGFPRDWEEETHRYSLPTALLTLDSI